MATLELSNGFIISGSENGYTKRIINGYDNGNIGRVGMIGTGTYSKYGQLLILKGAVPTNFSGLTTWASRSSDLLLKFTRDGGELLINFPGNNTALFSTIYKNATGSGTASWFWMMTTTGFGDSSETILQQFIGTVGTNGSGADMEISNTSVVSGNAYRVITSQITLPTSWTY